MSEKNTLLDRLTKRDAQRIDKLHKAHKAKEDIDASAETEDYFASTFKEKLEQIQSSLAHIPTLETKMLPNHFDGIKGDIIDLQKYVVTSALFLKEFNMRKYLGIVQNIQTECYEMEDKYIPRKKFGFNKKKLSKIETHKVPLSDELDENDGESRHKWDENVFGFDSKENEILHLEPEELYKRDVTLRNLKGCTIRLKGILGTLHMSNLHNCVVLCGPVSSSVFVDKCSNCKIVVACQQLRMHTSSDCDIYLHVTSKGIVEDCSNIRTAPYNLQYAELEKHLNVSSLDSNSNNWDNLDDFNWLAPDIPSPNWSIMDTSHRINDWSDWWSKASS